MHVERDRAVVESPAAAASQGKAPVVNVPRGLLREGSVGVAPDRGRPANASHTRLAYMLLRAGKHTTSKRPSSRDPTPEQIEDAYGACGAAELSLRARDRAGRRNP